MANYNLSLTDALILSEIDLNDQYYGSIESANIYFANRLKSDNWSNASDKDKSLALLEATERIERLAFDGEKVDSTQSLAFPRKYLISQTTYNTQTEIPLDIIKATYEEALSVLSDDDQEVAFKAERLQRSNVGRGQLEDQYFDKGMRKNILGGILSMRAWRLLMPYLKDDQEVTLIRV